MRLRILALAESLLERFGIPQENESLMGDLVEEYGSGRSSLWLSHQIVSAIAAKVARDIKNHKLLALRAIATGWVLQLIYGKIVNRLALNPSFNYRGVLFLCTMTLWPAFVGWVVCRISRAQRAAMVLLYGASMVAQGIWYFTVHYAEIKRMPIPNQLSIDIQYSCVALVFTLIGGFLDRVATLVGGFLRRPRMLFRK